MQETASILHTATSRSLVVLDEIGRVNRPDGLSIAWAVAPPGDQRPGSTEDTVRYALPRTDGPGGRTSWVVNAHVSAREWKDQIIFPAQNRQRAIRPQLRYPGRAPGRATGERGHASAGDPRRARAGRGVAWRPPHAVRVQPVDRRRRNWDCSPHRPRARTNEQKMSSRDSRRSTSITRLPSGARVVS